MLAPELCPLLDSIVTVSFTLIVILHQQRARQVFIFKTPVSFAALASRLGLPETEAAVCLC